MNCMLQTIGFSEVVGIEAERELKEKLVNETEAIYKKKTTARINDNRTAVELVCLTSKKTGVVYRGEYDKNGKFLTDCFFPAHYSKVLGLCEPLTISKRMDSNAYTAMAYSNKHKIPVIFYIQNVVDMYLDYDPNEKDKDYEVYLSAIADSGMILLPIEHQNEELPDEVDSGIGNELTEIAAKIQEELTGEVEEDLNEEIDSMLRYMTEKELADYINLEARLKNEDLYSIVETTFMPCGTEVDTYTVIGIIKSVSKAVNIHTYETMYHMVIKCGDLTFGLCINEKKLMGVPKAGRRFKGNIWLQGYVKWKGAKEE